MALQVREIVGPRSHAFGLRVGGVPAGSVTLTPDARSSALAQRTVRGSLGARHLCPSCECSGPEHPSVGCAQKMSPDAKQVLDHAMNRQKALRLPRDLKPRI